MLKVTVDPNWPFGLVNYQSLPSLKDAKLSLSVLVDSKATPDFFPTITYSAPFPS